ncbi:MAG: hypothetical protein B6I36_09880 [Desulfobacteraceae bacterium 4572_35.1]|nr:MAG: hypothetical protein B6I36_09880 [Desulfobacteraceae bacterium 4572_35.1]
MNRSSFLNGLISWMNEGGMCTFHLNGLPTQGGSIDPFKPKPVVKPTVKPDLLQGADEVLNTVNELFDELPEKNKAAARAAVRVIKTNIAMFGDELDEYVKGLK